MSEPTPEKISPAASSLDCPVRVTAIPAAQLVEWRTGDSLPRFTTPAWQLVYVRSGMVEELCDHRRVLLRPGALMIHQPEETSAMRATSELPPEVLRLEFMCSGPAMDALRSRSFHAEPSEQLALGWVCSMVPVVFLPPGAPGAIPLRKPDPPFAAMQQLSLYLENFLIYLIRRTSRQRKPSTRVQRERIQNAVIEAARLYFAEHIEQSVTVREVCAAIGYGKYQLNEAFATRLHHGPLEEFSNMKLAYAAQLLARGATPGEVTKRLGYCSGAYFSKRFHDAMDLTPSAYRRLQQGLPASRQKPAPRPSAQNVQQESKPDTETSIHESSKNR